MQFIDLQAQRRRIEPQINSAVQAVIEHGRYVMGPEVAEFERMLAEHGEVSHCISCANGTDALALPLMAWQVKPGDAIFCPAFTFVATAQVVPWLGAVPVFVDIDPLTYNMDPESLKAAIESVEAQGKLTPRAVIAVDLFGQPADYPALREICDNHGLRLIADSAQGYGCTLEGRHPAHWADITTTSFFPAKPLGCYGDGGAVLTNDGALAERIESLRTYGKVMPSDLEGQTYRHDPKYMNLRVGMNSRLDTIQAAILIEKLKIFDDEIRRRQAVAAHYNSGLAEYVEQVPHLIRGGRSVWAQYTIEHADRDGLQEHLKDAGIPSAVYYPIPLHAQEFARHYPCAPGGLPVTQAACERVISLPMHPYLDTGTQDMIIAEVASYGAD